LKPSLFFYVYLRLNISFSLDSSPKEFVFTDVTDYSAQSVTASDIIGSIKVTAPSGVVYGGQPDDIEIQPIAGGFYPGRINKNQILVPLLSDGTPEVGQYIFEYTATDGVDSVVYTKTVNFQYVKPTAGIQSVYDCLSPKLTTEDTTNYLYGSIDPSDRFNVASADISGNTFSISGEKSAFVRVGDTFSIISSTGNDGDYTVTSVAYNAVLDTTVIGVSSVVDATADGVLVTRKAQIFYPQVLGLNPLVGYSKKLETSVFYTNTHEFKYDTKSFYDLTDGVSIVDSNTDNQEIDIQCDVRLCEVFCCISSKFNEYLTYKNRDNKTLAEYALDQYVLATSHLAALRTAFECGKSADVTALTEQIKEVTQCNGDCSCDNGTPVLVTGLGGGTTTVVATSGNGIEVASVTAGSTTTYTLSLAQSILNDIANASATSSVSAGTGITVVATPSGSNTDYQVSVTTPAVLPEEMMVFKVEMDYDFSTGVRSYTVKDSTIQNASNLQNPTTFTETGITNIWDTYGVTVTGFQSVANSTYKVTVDSYFQEYSPGGVLDSDSTDSTFSGLGVRPSVVQTASGSFDLRFTDVLGNYLAKGSFGTYSKIYLTIKIYE
jgi:hypothetical protein